MSAENILKQLQALADPIKAEQSKRFFKSAPGEYAEGDEFYGISVPNQRKIAKRYKKMELSEVQKLIKSPIHEARLTAVLILVYSIERAPQIVIDEVAEFYLSNLRYVNNWDIVDSSAYHILGKYLESKERSLLYELAESNNLWEKRISIISCYYFIRKHDFDDALAISKLLLNDDHDLIHKAVGWMLREIGNRDRDVEEEFLLNADRYKTMPRTMLRYAIEKFEDPIRTQYLKGAI